MGEPRVLEALARLTRELGHVPVHGELRQRDHADPSFPTHKTIWRLGKKPVLVAKLRQFCEENPAYQDVAELLGPAPPTVSDEPPLVEGTKGKEQPLGCVYLLKSGKHYKIGRSNAPGRRERELQIQLPDPAKIVHEIRTDDPAGIEAYWHGRFKDRRLNGEWFALDSADVAYFRRRKFM